MFKNSIVNITDNIDQKDSFTGVQYRCVNMESAIQESEIDPITMESLRILKPNPHPCGSMSVRRCNGKIYFYNTQTIIDIINSQYNPFDPFSREPFSDTLIKRARIYHRCMCEIPDLNHNQVDCKKIYNEWKNDQKDPRKSLMARAILQPSDLLDFFRGYEGKGDMINRKKANIELSDKPIGTWLIRNASVRDTETCKGYVLSIKKKAGYKGVVHCLLIHKFGAGIYSDVGLKRGEEIPEIFNSSRCYPNIIDAIEDLIK